ncbi:MAG: nodulation protein NfeD [Deltaproteobacteria bacterium]|nr:nodulation protein NfeD [Deltaproteobacteria bacterium]
MTNDWCGKTFRQCCEKWDDYRFSRCGGVVLVLLLWSLLALPVQAGDPAPTAIKHINFIAIDATINPAIADFIHEGISRSVEEGAVALVIQLDTPGGLLNSTRTIVKDLLGAQLPVIVYVAPSGAGAGSAGVFITMAGHIAAMAPGTTIGAAHPVGGGGQDIKGDLGEKIENFTASFSESIAQRRGRNVEWAQKAVRDSVAITETEALQKKVVDVVATDIQDLLRKANGRKVEVGSTQVTLDFRPAQTAGDAFRIVQIDMRVKHRFLNFLADPNVAYLLMMAGILGLYVEFTNPGVVFPGVVGGICLLLAFAAFQVLPINYSGLLLVLLGIGLLIAEAFLPTFGVLGIGGVVSFILGSLFLFDAPDADLLVDRSIIASVGAGVALIMLFIATLAARTFGQRPVSGVDALIGTTGEVRVRIAPRGKVWVHGEYWNAESEETLEVGERIQVVGIKDLVLRVRKAVG